MNTADFKNCLALSGEAKFCLLVIIEHRLNGAEKDGSSALLFYQATETL